MNYNEVQDIKKNILSHLSRQEVKKACENLLKLAVNLREWQITEKLSEVETSYRYMLNYQFEGVDDPQRGEVFSGIIRTLYELTDDAADELMSLDSPNIFYEKQRLESFRTSPSLDDYRLALKEVEDSFRISELLEESDDKLAKLKYQAVKKERLGSDMFISVFVANRLSVDGKEEYTRFLADEHISVSDKCLFISAMTLNLLHRFDLRKLMVLLEAGGSEQVELKARAVVALVFMLMMYDKRLQYYSDWKNRLSSLMENESFRKLFETVLVQLIRSKETEKISRKMMDEIIPEMMKLSSKAGRKLSMEDLTSDIDLSGKNPEWKKELEDSGLADKLQEYSELHLEGADVFHSTFANLKNFPFFRDLDNWFLPYDTKYSQFLDLTYRNKSNVLMTAVSKSGYMCDSDKYSFSFSLLQIPEQQHQMLAARMGEESQQLEQLQKEEMLFNPSVNDEILTNQYIQNLYRFFKLFPRKDNFEDIFSFTADFYQYESLREFILQPDVMQRLAMYCFEKNRFADAENIYLLMTKEYGKNDEWWQKIGYCRQMQKNIEGAVEAYKEADILDTQNSWVIKRLAHCYRLLKRPEIALEYFRRVEQMQPDNMTLMMNIGHCCLEMENYNEALNYYFKVEFSDSANTKPQRPIAWTAFLAGKYELSESYYEQLIADRPSLHDYLNMGHIYLLTNRLKQAVESYVQSLKLAGSFGSFLKYFMEDEDILRKVGIDEEIIPRLLDQIRYKQENG